VYAQNHREEYVRGQPAYPCALFLFSGATETCTGISRHVLVLYFISGGVREYNFKEMRDIFFIVILITLYAHEHKHKHPLPIYDLTQAMVMIETQILLYSCAVFCRVGRWG
jgi:hypothetical protein